MAVIATAASTDDPARRPLPSVDLDGLVLWHTNATKTPDRYRCSQTNAPDMTTLGKYLGGGMTFGANAGHPNSTNNLCP